MARRGDEGEAFLQPITPAATVGQQNPSHFPCSGYAQAPEIKSRHTKDTCHDWRKATAVDLKTQAKELGFDLSTGQRTGRNLCLKLREGRRFRILAWTIAILIYFFLGAMVYTELNGWSFSASAYYAIQNAWCVGFGAIEEDTNLSRAWTILFNLTGASIIGAAVVYFLQTTLDNHEAWKMEELSYVMNKEAISDLQEASRSRIGSADLEYVESPSFYLPGPTDGFKTLFQATKNAVNKVYSVLPLVLVAAWIVGGVLYGMKYEGWDFTVSLYFTTTALTTSGLQAPSVDTTRDCFANWFMAVYVLFGVPLFAASIGWVASKLFEGYARSSLREKVSKRLAKEDLEFASLVLANTKRGKKVKISYGEFLEFMFIRLSLVDLQMLKDLRHRFGDLDKKNRGHITLEDIQAELEFERFDLEKDGVIKMVEFVTICGNLGIGAVLDMQL